MLRLLATLVLLAAQTVSTGTLLEPFRLDDPQVKAYHHIRQRTAVEGDSCSAAAIGPHALLTATHCELGTDVVNVDGQDYLIAEKIRDGADHTIFILPAADFKDILRVSERDFVPGERVRGWGWPGGRKDVIYKEGIYVGPIPELADLHGGEFAYPVFSGDSGGPVIDESGAAITVVSLGDSQGDMAVFPLNFTPDQLAVASR